MCLRIMCLVAVLALCGSLAAQAPPPYVIVTDADLAQEANDPFAAVVRELAKLRQPVEIIALKTDEPATIREALAELQPRFIAFVVRPERIEDNFVGEVFEMLTKLDDDPELDAAHGYITGATTEDALQLVRNTAAAEQNREHIPRKFVAIAHTFAGGDLSGFAAQNVAVYSNLGFEAAGINPIDGSEQWRKQADVELQKLENASLVFLAGHGMGDWSCAINGSKFGQHKLNAAVVVNGSCHSAVTMLRRDCIDQNAALQSIGINPRESVCLNFIAAGAVGQYCSTASSSWSNVGFAVNGLHEGQPQGEALMHSLNDKIRATGLTQIDVMAFVDGKPSPQFLGEDQNPGGIQSIARVVLIGDPAYRPFEKPLN